MMRMVLLCGVLLGLPGLACLTFDTDVPMERCRNGDPLPLSDQLDATCRSAVDTVLANETPFDGFVAMTNDGEVLYEWGETDLPTNVASVRKSVVSILFGIASERGLLDLDATLGEIGVGDQKSPLTEAEREATIRDLLQSRSGIYAPSLGEASSWAAVRPDRGAYANGEYWFYNNWDFNALGTVFEHETGLTLETALEQWLAIPLGMRTWCTNHATYESSSETEHDMYRFYMSAADLARIGLLVMQGGEWRGEQVVSRAWIDEITRRVSDVRTIRPEIYYSHYGYLWWIDESGHIWADGSGGQFIHIDPDAQLVTVAQNRTGNSIPGRLWYRMADTFGTPEDQKRAHSALEACR